MQSELLSFMMVPFLFSYNSTTKSLVSTLFLAHYHFLTMMHLRKLFPSPFCSNCVLWRIMKTMLQIKCLEALNGFLPSHCPFKVCLYRILWHRLNMLSHYIPSTLVHSALTTELNVIFSTGTIVYYIYIYI